MGHIILSTGIECDRVIGVMQEHVVKIDSNSEKREGGARDTVTWW
jgi:hypothetical protein